MKEEKEYHHHLKPTTHHHQNPSQSHFMCLKLTTTEGKRIIKKSHHLQSTIPVTHSQTQLQN